ncbi:glycosyltransferase family 4 protein [Nodosilinea sp. FACHB-131]|uniref:glycosyltransferase family 4 protein n=1 Tax=Cyanophyceae TaxID=3028117 RepID=UPI0016849A7E|nr:glycosyltransferase family 4 protein [Nodosilinea sp. FACHB-131]MBD1876700.1 glycosyltransferase family 4 protein [Nodosilinea sp. FACHB-131]
MAAAGSGTPLLRILLVSGVYPPAGGGPSLQTKHLAQGLMARGIAVQVVTYGDPTASGSLDGVSVRFLDGGRRDSLGGKLGRNLEVCGDLDRTIRQFRPSVIHMQTAAGNLALITGVLARWHRLPTLIKYTADLVQQNATLQDFSASNGWRNRLIQGANCWSTEVFQRVLFALYSCIWATTPRFQQRLGQHYGVAASKIVLLPNFIDLQPFRAIARHRPISQPSAPLELLTVARLFPVKGLDLYLRALARLPDLPLRARIVGSGSETYRQQLLALVHELDLGDRVELSGAIDPEAIASAYATADLFVLPSRHEPFGIVLIEAMAAGLPIVATEVDGIPQVVEAGVSAVLVPPENVERLAIALRTLATDSQRRLALAHAGQHRAQSFGLEAGIQGCLAIYAKLSPHPWECLALGSEARPQEHHRLG